MLHTILAVVAGACFSAALVAPKEGFGLFLLISMASVIIMRVLCN